MNNYHYIVSSLPALSLDYRFTKETPAEIKEQILELCSERDQKVISFLESGYLKENMTADFYREALAHKNPFIRAFFCFDLNVRNAKVEYLNSQLGREKGTDVVILSEESVEFEESNEVAAALSSADLLTRERALDELYWRKIESLTLFNYFDITTILGFIARLHIVARWFELDEQKGREKFRQLVDEVRGTFKGVEYKN